MTELKAIALDVVELRRYAMRPGRRDELIALFEREFIEGQEACGMIPVGHYRDADDPDCFVWFRGFANMQSRRRALDAFYLESTVWRANRDAANATMSDSDNVLLLRPARSGSGFDLNGTSRPSESEPRDESRVAVAIYMLREPASEALVSGFERSILPQLERLSHRIAYFVTEPSPNDVPRLPVREREWAFVACAPAEDGDVLEACIEALETSNLSAEARANVIGAEYLRLLPAARSLYR